MNSLFLLITANQFHVVQQTFQRIGGIIPKGDSNRLQRRANCYVSAYHIAIRGENQVIQIAFDLGKNCYGLLVPLCHCGAFHTIPFGGLFYG